MPASDRLRRQLRFCLQLVTVLVLVAIAGRGFQLFMRALEPSVDPRNTTVYLQKRFESFFEHLDRAPLKGQHVVVFWGLSDVEMNVDTLALQNAVSKGDLTVLNAGARALPADLFPALMRSVQRRLSERGAASIRFVVKPPLLTLSAQAGFSQRRMDKGSVLIPMWEAQSLFEPEWGGFATAANLGLRKLFLGRHSNTVLEMRVRDFIEGPVASQDLGLFSSPVLIENGHWNAATGGRMEWEKVQSETKDVIADATENLLEHLERRYGFLEPVPDPRLLQLFTHGINSLKKLGVKIELIHYPDFLAQQGRRSKSGEEALEKMMSEITRRTGLSLEVIGNQAAWEPEDYLDLLHLSHSGQAKLTEGLVKFMRKSAAAQ
jgi:hypothetical protein